MLRQLSIENVAVIEKADIEFDNGFNVLTGETGAGKSILIDSINAILGNRTSKEIVRSGAQKASIWAQFDDIPARTSASLAENGYDCDSQLIVYREIFAGGKSSCRINNKPATAALVRDICGDLVNIHGQHDSQALLNPERHIDIIDKFAELDSPLADYRADFARLGAVRREIERLSMDDSEKARRLDLLRYQADEIAKAKFVPGEEEELSARRLAAVNSEKIIAALRTATQSLNGDNDSGGALALLWGAVTALEAAGDYALSIKTSAERLSEIYYNLADAASEVQAGAEDTEFDAGDAEKVEERLDVIYKLKNKYGDSIQAVLDYGADAERQIDSIEMSDETLEKLRGEYDAMLALCRKKAAEISEKRAAAFVVFEKRIKDEVAYLNMPGVVFTVNRSECELNRHGCDSVEFFISTNPGELPKPLAKIASGGELSRIMLAIKNALADKDDIPTLIFDEIDTGISGTSSQRIGRKLRQASQTRQIICVTHSAPIAAYSNAHLLIEKSVSDGRTYTTVHRLEGNEKTRELARIISGDNITEISLRNAAEMLALAQINKE